MTQFSKSQCNCGCPSRRQTHNARNGDRTPTFSRRANQCGCSNFYKPLTFRDDLGPEPYDGDPAGSSDGDSDYGVDGRNNNKKWYIPEKTDQTVKKELVPPTKAEDPRKDTTIEKEQENKKKGVKKTGKPRIMRGNNKRATKVQKGRKRSSSAKSRRRRN